MKVFVQDVAVVVTVRLVKVGLLPLDKNLDFSRSLFIPKYGRLIGRIS